jgi:rRNA processing protein Krr1/Pno1
MSAEDVVLSKSARKRANKKAREAGDDQEEAPAPAPAPKSKAAAKPKAEPAPEPKAAAKGKAKAKAEPKAAEAAPKAKGKAAPKAAAEPKAAEPKAKAAAEPKSKAAAKKAAAKKAPEPEPEEKKDNGPLVYTEVDDGSRAGDWEVSTGLSNKAAKQKAKQLEKEAMQKEMAKANVLQARGTQYIPGMASAEAQVAQAKGGKKAAASQGVGATFVVSAAAQAASKDAPVPSAAVSDNSTSATVKVPENRIGIVVGPKGATIIMIKEKTGVTGIDMAGEICTIVGPANAVTLAEHAVRQLVEKGYCSLAYDDFEEEGVPVLPSLFPDIIGSKGAIIQVIKKEAKVEVNIPAVPKNALPGKKYKVTLAGSKAAVALGKEIINSIALYGHHEITHPGQVHKEMEIEEWRYRFLIGSKGSEMRHIQNNYKVKVSIPREHSECQNVVIVGEPRDVERAVAYVEKIMWDADQPRGRGAADKAEDTWGDEGEEEDWMKAYMYKR